MERHDVIHEVKASLLVGLDEACYLTPVLASCEVVLQSFDVVGAAEAVVEVVDVFGVHFLWKIYSFIVAIISHSRLRNGRRLPRRSGGRHR